MIEKDNGKLLYYIDSYERTIKRSWINFEDITKTRRKRDLTGFGQDLGKTRWTWFFF